MNGPSQCRIPTPGDVSYRVLHTLPEIEAIAGEWDLLLDQSPCNRAFSCSKWFLVSCALDPSITPRVVIAQRGDTIVGVLPLVLVNDAEIATFASELSDYNDIIARENDLDIATGLLEYAISQSDGYKQVILSRIRSDSNCLRAARILKTADDFDRTTGSTQYVRLPSTYDEYLATRSRNFRKSLNRARRKAKEQKLTIRELEPEHFPPEQVAEEFLSLNFNRWGAESYYQLPFPQAFVRQLIPELFSQKRMRVFALLKEEELIGLDLCMIGKNSLCTWNGGFLSDSEQFSPGNLLIAAGIKRAYDLNLAEYDLLRGNETYKQRWANSVRSMEKIEFEVNQHAALLTTLPKSWSIGIYAGESPFHLQPLEGIVNPVLSRSDVSDIPASFVADPFMIRADGSWYMFFEAKHAATRRGEIGLAVSSEGCDWHYDQIVLAEPFHLSYPYVFESEGEYYMVPETLEAKQIRLYKATCFPYRWIHLTDLVSGDFADPTIFQSAGKWWMFACSNPFEHDVLRLFFAERLIGPWREHPRSPLIESNPHIARPAGRVIECNGNLIRFAQDCYPKYGTQVRAFEILELTPASYLERECENSPILVPGVSGWNKHGMHHIDVHVNSDGKWIACVDGNSRVLASTKSADSVT